jgi:hypothetical protein
VNADAGCKTFPKSGVIKKWEPKSKFVAKQNLNTKITDERKQRYCQNCRSKKIDACRNAFHFAAKIAI